MRFSAFLTILLHVVVGAASPTPVDIEERASCITGLPSAAKAAVQRAFTSSGVVPTLIPSINPLLGVQVAYGKKQVLLGNEFTTAETLDAPEINFDAEPGYNPVKTKYSVFLVDPDVPNSGATGLSVNFLHYYVAHAKPYCVKNQTPQTITIYEPLTPASTQQHRYTFLVYREPPGYVPDAVTAQARPGFDINGYAAKAGLKLVGGNFLREAITNT